MIKIIKVINSEHNHHSTIIINRLEKMLLDQQHRIQIQKDK